MKVRFTVVAAASMVAMSLGAQIPSIPVTANTNISISGLLAVGAKASSITHTSRTGLADEYYLCDNTSRLYINANSKIADGWLVIGQIGSRFEVNNGPGNALVPAAPAVGTTGALYGGWAEDDTWGGISSPYGTITFGKCTIYYSDTIATDALGVAGAGESYRIWDANNLATFNLLDGVQQYSKGFSVGSKYTMGNTRSQNTVRYTSPMLGKFMLVVAASKNPYGSELQYGDATPFSYENGGMIFAKGIYNDGPLSSSLSLLDVKVQGGMTVGNGNTQAYRAGVAYKFPFGLKVGVVFDHTAVTNSIITATNPNGDTAKRDVVEVPVAYYIGDHALFATYTHAGNTSSISNSSATQYNLGYDYSLTKRAFVGVSYASIINGTASAYAPFLAATNLGPTSPVMGENWHQVSLDFQYWF
jgi:predicted porin